jgi:hypothetical protein
MEPSYGTPEAAARGDVPEQFAHTLGIEVSADRRHAVVLVGTNEQSDPYPYQVVCAREGERWVESIGGNGPGWSATGDQQSNVGVLTAWGEAPAASTVAVIGFGGREHEVAVHRGYYLFVAWDVPDDDGYAPPVVGRFR